jgi:hypothetical protein
MYYQTQTAAPCAYITKSKQRLKQNSDRVYLANNDEFEIELFNPKNISVLAKIKLNGNYISNGGIVLKPGQRVFIERFLDQPKKFKFETYQVDKNSNQAKQAIQNNGDVEVEFYDESLVYPKNIVFPHIGTTTGGNTNTFTTNGLNMSGNIGTTTNLSYNTSTFSDKIETGTVEKGSYSDQSFSFSDKQFEFFYCTKSYWKILPISEKVYSSKDLKKYCPECGSTIKKTSWKFCPSCGEDLQFS